MTANENDPFMQIFNAIKNDPQNEKYTKAKIDPLYAANENAEIVIVGQAPGQKAQDKRKYWDDASGKRLREWLGIDYDTFYASDKLAIMPLDFYFPGHGKSGDLPPRKGFAQKWHPQLMALMPKVKLIILVGSYATKHYLHLKSATKLTDVVYAPEKYLPEDGRNYAILVHPSPRNQIWLKKHPWFEQRLAALKHTVAEIMAADD